MQSEQQIQSEMTGLIEVAVAYTGLSSDSIEVTVDSAKKTISATIKEIQFDSVEDFPEVGSENLIYVDKTQNTPYRFDKETGEYKSLGKDLTDEFKALEKEIEGVSKNSINDIIVNNKSSVKIVDEKKQSEISIKIEQDTENNLLYYLSVNGERAGEINIPKDQFLKSVEYDSETDTLIFTWVTETGEQTTRIDMSDLVDVYSAGDGIKLKDNQFGIKLDDTSSNALTVSENGLKLDLSNYVDLNSEQRLTNKEFNFIDIVGEQLIPIYENQETIFNYEYNVENISTTYGFVLNDDGYYESNNKKMPNSYALCKLSFNMWIEGDLTFEIINSGESNYDFGIFSKLDQTLTNSNAEDTSSTLVYKSYKGQSSTSPVTLTYSNVSAGEHFITIKFKKDGSGDNGNDSLQFKVINPVGEVTIITPVIVGYEDYIGKLDIDEDKDLTYNGEKISTYTELNNLRQEISEKYVDLTNEQKIQGKKIFLKDIVISAKENMTSVSGLYIRAYDANTSGYNSISIYGGDSRSAGPDGVLIGTYNSGASGTGSISIGSSSKASASHTIAIGPNGHLYETNATATGAIQIGKGTNSDAWSLKVFDYKLLEQNGKIPNERLDPNILIGMPVASKDTIGGIKVWVSDDTLFISTSYYENNIKDSQLEINGAYQTSQVRNTVYID
jgi:hypothetical protein